MNRCCLFSVLAAAILAGGGARAQMPAENTIPIPPIELQKIPPVQLYQVSVSYSMGFNITADFKNIGAFPKAGGGPGAATAGVDHEYDNGYNRVDITGNDHGGYAGTWYWGYQNDNQISGDSLVMQSSSLAHSASSCNNSADPQPGFEMTIGRELGRDEHWRWGIEGAFGFTAVTINDNRTLSGNVSVVRDSYALSGVIPPLPPYSGTYDGPGPIVSDTPTRNTEALSRAATITGSREFDAQLFGFKLGPYVQIPISRRWFCSLRGGVTAVAVNSRFTYQETTSIPGLGSYTSSASGYHSDWLAGVYAGGNIAWALNDSASLFAGAQYQNVGQYTQSLNGRKAVLDLSKSIFVAIGFSYSY